MGTGTSLLVFPLSAARSSVNADGGNGACSGAADSADFSGQLALLGGPLPASTVAGVTLSYSYLQESVVHEVANGSVLSTSCTEETGFAVTNATGGFSFQISPSRETCGPDPPYGETCTTYSAPYAPVTVSVTSATPAGYGLSVNRSGTWFAVDWVAELAATAVAPSTGPIVASVGAPVTFVATPLAANGTLSPLTPVFNWTLTGPDWTFLSSPGTGNSAEVVPITTAGEGDLTVSASAAVGANTFRTPVVNLPLVSVATAVSSGRVDRTTADAGSPVTVEVNATGATGYSYTANISAGLGLPPLTEPCVSTATAPTVVSVQCSALVTYPTPGTAEMAVNVSNGFSSAAWNSPYVTVDPAAALQATPFAPKGYAGSPIPITLTAASDSGVPPYSTACFASRAISPECKATAGPTWMFRPTFPTAGRFSATAWAVDATGTNRSLSLNVTVANPPTVGTLELSSPNASAGSALTLSSFFSGGALPAEVWWNGSNQPSPISSYRLDSDGSLSAGFVPPSVGPLRLSLTVRDSFGTVVETSLTVSVGVGPATSVEIAGNPPSSPVVVGTPLSFEWRAVDPVDELVPNFAGAGVLSVAGSGGTPALAYANLSGPTPLSSSPEGSFVVPSSAWTNGILDLTLTPISAGTLTITLEGSGIPGLDPVVSLTATPDPTHLRLFDPTVVLPGDRVNATFWHVSDWFGNAVPGAYLIVENLVGSTSVARSVPVDSLPGGGTGAWLNYSLPVTGGTVRVLDAAGDLLLGPVMWTGEPPATTRSLTEAVMVVAAPVGLLVATSSAVLGWRRRKDPSIDEAEAAHRLAEGRESVLELVRRDGVASWESIEGAWAPQDSPPDLADWLASLVADGTLLTNMTTEGAIEYRVAPVPPESPQVTLDESALDRAMARREAVALDADERDL